MNRNIMTATALVFSLATTSAFAATCDNAAMPKAPGVPSATDRTFESMLAAQNDVRTYVTASKEYLKCVRSSSRHNALVDQIYAVADEYNTALAEFRASTR